VPSTTRLKASFFFSLYNIAVSPRYSAKLALCLRYRHERATICSGNSFPRDSTHAFKYDVITASECLLYEKWRQVIEVDGLSDRVTVFSSAVVVLQSLCVFRGPQCIMPKETGLFRC
jgi:hypothetical protein